MKQIELAMRLGWPKFTLLVGPSVVLPTPSIIHKQVVRNVSFADHELGNETHAVS